MAGDEVSVLSPPGKTSDENPEVQHKPFMLCSGGQICSQSPLPVPKPQMQKRNSSLEAIPPIPKPRVKNIDFSFESIPPVPKPHMWMRNLSLESRNTQEEKSALSSVREEATQRDNFHPELESELETDFTKLQVNEPAATTQIQPLPTGRTESKERQMALVPKTAKIQIAVIAKPPPSMDAPILLQRGLHAALREEEGFAVFKVYPVLARACLSSGKELWKVKRIEYCEEQTETNRQQDLKVTTQMLKSLGHFSKLENQINYALIIYNQISNCAKKAWKEIS